MHVFANMGKRPFQPQSTGHFVHFGLLTGPANRQNLLASKAVHRSSRDHTLARPKDNGILPRKYWTPPSYWLIEAPVRLSRACRRSRRGNGRLPWNVLKNVCSSGHLSRPWSWERSALHKRITLAFTHFHSRLPTQEGFRFA
jgi:hypothetical protein